MILYAILWISPREFSENGKLFHKNLSISREKIFRRKFSIFSHFGLSRIMQIFFALICLAKKCKAFVKIEMQKSREKIRKFHQEFIKVKEEKLLIMIY